MRPAILFAALLAASSAAQTDPDVTVHRFGDVPFHACALSTRGVPDAIEGFCARVEVPLDHSAPDGKKISLSLAWLKPLEKAGGAPDPAVFLAGGPGQAAREHAAYFARVFREARRRHAFLFIDQRGTGESTPLTCPDEPEDTELEPDARAATMKKCREAFPADPQFFTTRDAVEDLELLRKRLGGVRFDLLGVSYGTRLAQEYARAHPDGVRSLVLDGVVPPSLTLGKGFGSTLDAALAASSGACVGGGDGGCEVPLATLDAALVALEKPRHVTYADPYTGAPRERDFGARELMRLVHTAAYQPLFVAALPQLFRDARDGNLAPLAAQLRVTERSAGVSSGLHFAVACAEDVPRLTDADGEEEARTRLGRAGFDGYRAICREWPRHEAPAARLEPLSSDAPALLLSGEWDPVTPPSGAAQVAAGLKHAKHLVLRGQGHNVIAVGCVPRVLARFLDEPVIEKLDTACVDRIRPLKPFTSRVGWEP